MGLAIRHERDTKEGIVTEYARGKDLSQRTGSS